MFDMYNPINEESSFQRADIQVYESMMKIKVPVSESYNEMKLASKKKNLGPKYMLAQAIIKKYKDKIFWKHECKIKREERKSSQRPNEDNDQDNMLAKTPHIVEPKSDQYMKIARNSTVDDFIIEESDLNQSLIKSDNVNM